MPTSHQQTLEHERKINCALVVIGGFTLKTQQFTQMMIGELKRYSECQIKKCTLLSTNPNKTARRFNRVRRHYTLKWPRSINPWLQSHLFYNISERWSLKKQSKILEKTQHDTHCVSGQHLRRSAPHHQNVWGRFHLREDVFIWTPAQLCIGMPGSHQQTLEHERKINCALVVIGGFTIKTQQFTRMISDN